MNFLRTQLIQRQSDLMKVRLDGQVWESQSILNVQSGHGITFAQTETHNVSTLTVSVGDADGSIGYWGAFYDTTDQTITSTTTAYVVGLNNSGPNNDGVSVVDGNKVTVAHTGVYNIATSVQLTSTSVQIHDAWFWFRKNGVDLPDSCSQVSVPQSHGGNPGALLFYVNIMEKLNAGDYIQLVWNANDTAVSLETIPAAVSPVRPRNPSVILTINQV
jgi:hypothetical protein